MTTRAYNSLVETLEGQGVRLQEHPEADMVTASFKGDAGVYAVVGLAAHGLLEFTGQAPFAIPEGARTVMAEAVSRANLGMHVGGFQLDLSDGQLVFRASSVLVDDRITDMLVVQLLSVVLGMLDRYTPAFLSIIYANETPRAAIMRCEATL